MHQTVPIWQFYARNVRTRPPVHCPASTVNITGDFNRTFDICRNIFSTVNLVADAFELFKT